MHSGLKRQPSGTKAILKFATPIAGNVLFPEKFKNILTKEEYITTFKEGWSTTRKKNPLLSEEVKKQKFVIVKNVMLECDVNLMNENLSSHCTVRQVVVFTMIRAISFI
jgi:hypothetical protein